MFRAGCLVERQSSCSATLNRKALAFSAINAAVNDVAAAKIVFSDVLAGIEGMPTLLWQIRPIWFDEQTASLSPWGWRTGNLAASGSPTEGLARLTPGGRSCSIPERPSSVVLTHCSTYIEPVLNFIARHFVYEEIDPDVFGEELEKKAYASVDRIAAMGLAGSEVGSVQ